MSGGEPTAEAEAETETETETEADADTDSDTVADPSGGPDPNLGTAPDTGRPPGRGRAVGTDGSDGQFEFDVDFGWGRGIDVDPRTLLESPLVGRHRRRTLVALASLLAFTLLFTVSYAGTVVTVDGAPLETLTTRFDSISALLIAVATATMAIAPLVYAV